jgi:hypothetical protein
MGLEERMQKIERQVRARDAVRSREARAALSLAALAFLAWLSIPWIAIEWHYYSLSPLQRAAYDGDEVECERLVKAGAPIDATDDAGETVLYHAVWRAHIDATRTLIALGADVNKPDLFGQTLLQKYETTSGRGHPLGTPDQREGIAKLLRSHGAR